MIYLASPYSSPDPLIQKTRFLITEQFVNHTLQTQNLIVFSPILYLHEFAQKFNLPTNANFYMTFNMNMLRRSESMFLLKLRGWEESKGVTIELNGARMLSIPVIPYNADFECELFDARH